MSTYGKILNGKTQVKFSTRDDIEKVYLQVNADECPDGFKEVEKALPYPTPSEGHEIAFLVEDVGDKLTKTGFLVKPGTKFFGRKFSKLKIYGAISKLGAWKQIQDWLESKNIDGINGWLAFQLAQEISDEHRLFAPLSEEARVMLGLTEDQLDDLLNQCLLDA